MGYVEKTLGNGEKIEHIVNFHWLWMFFAYLFLTVGSVLAIVAFLYVPELLSQEQIDSAWVYLMPFFSFVAGLSIYLSMMIKKWTTERVLTDTRFIKKTGWIMRKTEEIRIDRMEEINLDQSVLGRLFDYGDVKISGMGMGGITLSMIDSPIEFQKRLNDLKVQYFQQTGIP
tara:strand:+ start:1847 stop:2362 length:516 start_codon:yes stop_codon:yes gene_type:complete